MFSRQYLIDEICRLSGFSRRTVRYYVQEGLVDPPAGRGRGGYYSDVQVGQLARIRQLQVQGYRLEAIRSQLLGGVERGPREALQSLPSRSSREVPGRKSSGMPVGTSAAPHSEWIRLSMAPGVELHLSAEAQLRFGPITETTVEKLLSIIRNRGGSNE